MRKYLISKEGNFYKANLHVHSTISDGAKPPEEVKKIYMDKGYSVVAFTDHNILYNHNKLTDENFVALNGMEIDFYEGWNPDFVDKGMSWNSWKGIHACFIALDPNNLNQPCWHRTKNKVLGSGYKYVPEIKFDESKPDFEKIYSIEGVNKALKEARDSGFYVIYSHPTWNCEDYREYSQYENLHAMEICNYSCYLSGWDEYNPRVYDDILRTGKMIHCVAVDDSHVGRPLDSKRSDVGGGYIMIKSNKLDYKSITDNLVKGNFYASTGPEIKELYFEDGYIHITCSPAERIFMTTSGRRKDIAYDEDGHGLTKAKFKVYTPKDGGEWYVRLTVEDFRGKRANTNAYLTEELYKD